MTALRPIGILGGMGPEATVLLQRKLIEATPAKDDSDHIPLLIDMNPQVPSRIAHLIEGTGPNPGPTLATMSQRLEAAGAAALAMPCNTAHHYADHITAAVGIPLLNMVEHAADYAAKTLPRGGAVGMLASPAVQMTGLFDTALGARGLRVIWPADGDAALAAIRAIKTHGDTPEARAALHRLSGELVAAGAELQFIACSEFSIIADCVAPGAPAIDTLDLLCEAILAFSGLHASA